MLKKVAVLIDGGCLRAWASQAGKSYDADFVERVARSCVDAAGEELFRILYYDCPQFEGSVASAVTKTPHSFKHPAGPDLLHELSVRDFFAVRRGVLKFRGWELKKPAAPGAVATDADFKPKFQQKGVDLRIGLDIAEYSALRVVDRLAVLTEDTDMQPALKHARIAGLQLVLIALSGGRRSELRSHADITRIISLP